ncbi:MAG TPA: heme A synthase [Alphaproteobacteria bacterium]|nr:heme A synthase [Alphaproteobacteria bacterium]
MLGKVAENKFVFSLKILSGLLLLLIFFQISLGSAVRLTGSGLSCPDWPLCYGLWFPDQDKLSKISDVNFEFYQVMLEWIHRFNAAAFITPVTLLVFFVGLKVTKDKINQIILYIIILILALQGLMGGFTVFDKNSPWSVAVHLGLALSFMFLVLKIFLVSLNIKLVSGIPCITKKISTLIGAIITVLATMLMGAIVSKSGSSLACDIWPLCSNDGVSIFQHNKIIHLSHRILALISVIFVFLIVNFFKDVVQYKIIFVLRNILISLIILQILIGATVIFTELNLFIAMLHQAIAVILFIVLSFLFWFTLQSNFKRN